MGAFDALVVGLDSPHTEALCIAIAGIGRLLRQYPEEVQRQKSVVKRIVEFALQPFSLLGNSGGRVQGTAKSAINGIGVPAIESVLEGGAQMLYTSDSYHWGQLIDDMNKNAVLEAYKTDLELQEKINSALANLPDQEIAVLRKTCYGPLGTLLKKNMGASGAPPVLNEI